MGFGLGICGSCCGTTACGQICVTIRGCADGYNTGSFPVPWATVGVTSAGGFSGTCTPVTSITAFTVKTAGTGYTNTATAAITGTGGSLATAFVYVDGGAVVAIAINNAGTGFTGPSSSGATVTISGGGGSGATASATLLTTTVASFSVTAAGSGFTTTPTVAVDPPTSGTTATGRALLTGTTVNSSITLVSPGANVATRPTVTFTNPTGQAGSGAAATARMHLAAVNVVAAGGSGYTVGDVLTLSGGTSTTAATLTVTAVTGGSIDSASVTNPGLYTALPPNNVSVTGGTGTGATFDLLWAVDSILLTNAGTAYTAPPLITFSIGTASATCVLIATTLASITRVGAGTGYNTAPGVTVTGGGGSGASASSALTGRGVASLAVTAGGTGYASPTITITGTGTGTTVGTRVSSGAIQQVIAIAGGSGYTMHPTVAVTGGGGTGGVVTAKCVSTCCVATTGNGSYTLAVAADRFTTSTTTVVISGCATSNQTITLVVAAGYKCIPGCFKPLPTTLHISCGLGTLTATWNTATLWNVLATFTATVGQSDGTGVHCSGTSSGSVDMVVGANFSIDAPTQQAGVRISQTGTAIQCCSLAGHTTTDSVWLPSGGDTTAIGTDNGAGNSVTVFGCSDPLSVTGTLGPTYAAICGNSLSLPVGTATVTE